MFDVIMTIVGRMYIPRPCNSPEVNLWQSMSHFYKLDNHSIQYYAFNIFFIVLMYL